MLGIEGGLQPARGDSFKTTETFGYWEAHNYLGSDSSDRIALANKIAGPAAEHVVDVGQCEPPGSGSLTNAPSNFDTWPVLLTMPSATAPERLIAHSLSYCAGPLDYIIGSKLAHRQEPRENMCNSNDIPLESWR